MPTVAVAVAGRIVPESSQARIISANGTTLVLPWWPSEVENSGLAGSFTDISRPNRAPLLARAADPLPSLRLAFTVSADSLNSSIQKWLEQFKVVAKADAVVQVLLGQSDRGRFVIVDAGATEVEHAASGEPSVADVILMLRSASDADLVVGPVRKKSRKR